jgi:hypothetical protein
VHLRVINLHPSCIRPFKSIKLQIDINLRDHCLGDSITGDKTSKYHIFCTRSDVISEQCEWVSFKRLKINAGSYDCACMQTPSIILHGESRPQSKQALYTNRTFFLAG